MKELINIIILVFIVMNSNYISKIVDLEDVLQREDRVIKIIQPEAIEIRDRYGDERRTEIAPPASSSRTPSTRVVAEVFS